MVRTFTRQNFRVAFFITILALFSNSALAKHISEKAQTLSSQTINFHAITDKLYSAADFSIGATATSGLPIHYVSSNEAVATITDNDLSTAKIHIVGVGAVTITAQQAGDNVNYAAALDKTQSFTVNKGHLIIKAANKAKNYGAANPAFSITYSGFKTGENASAFTTQPVAKAVDGSNNPVTAASLPGSYNIEFSVLPAGSILNNYDAPTFTSGVLTINKASLKITSNVSKVYGAALPTLPVTYTGFVNGDTKNDLTTQATAYYDSSQPLPTQTSEAGVTYIIKLSPASGPVLANYNVTYPDGKLTVIKAPLKISAPALSKVYGGIVPEPLAPVYTGFVNGDNESMITTNPTFKIIDKAASTPVTNFSPASSSTIKYIITKNTLAAGSVLNNYTVTYVDGIFTIAKAPLNIAVSNMEKNYGDANPINYQYVYTGFLGTDNTSNSITTLPVATHTATLTSGVNTTPTSYGIKPSGALSPNYTITYTLGYLTINKKPLIVSIADKSKVYGANLPVFTFEYSGLIPADNVPTPNVLTIKPTVTTTATKSSAVGQYDVIFSTAVMATARNYEISYSSTPGKLTVIPASLNIIATDRSKIYGGVNPVLTFTYTGLVNGDKSTMLTTLPTGRLVNNNNPATAVSATSPITTSSQTYSIVNDAPAVGDVLNNYTVTYTNGVLTINPALLKITANTNKAYGAALPATLPVRYSGFVNGQTKADLTTPATADYDHTQPLPNTLSPAGSIFTLKASGAAGHVLDNYTVTYPDGKLTIIKARLRVIPTNQVKTYGSPNPVFTFTYEGFVGSDNAGSITTPPVITPSPANAEEVGVYPFTLSGGLANNYTFYITNTSTDGKLNIVKANLTIIADDKTKRYGDANPEFTFTYSGFNNGDNAANSITTPPTITTIPAVNAPAGTYQIYLSGAVSPNYSIAAYTPGTLTITKADLNITTDNKTRKYGEVNPDFTASYSGFISGDDATNSFTTAPTATTTAVANSATGIYQVNMGNAVSPNYNLTYHPGNLTITKADLILTAENKSRVYGVANPAFTATYAGFIDGDNVANSFTTAPSVTTEPADLNSPIGTYPINFTGGVSQNYNIITYNPGTLTIGKAELTIIADNKTRKYGEANPEFTASYSGFLTGDNAANSITTAPTLTVVPANANSPVGIYQINFSGAVSPNYNIVGYTPGTLAITKADLDITADSKTRKYGEATPNLTASYSGFVSGDDATNSFTTAPVATTTAVTNSATGIYQINIDGAVSPNYNLIYHPGNLTINKADLILTAENKTRIYGTANPVFTATYAGFMGSDNVANSFTTAPSVSAPASLNSPVGTYPINFTGGVSQNYNIVTYNPGTLTIGKADITITADNKSRKYGEANPAFTASYSGFIGGDNAANSFTTQPTVTTVPANASSPVGTYQITFSGAVSTNYNIVNYNPGTLNITKADLIATADNKTKKYGEANPEFTASYSGFINGDNAANSITTAPSATTAASPNSATGTYQINLTGAVSSNYNIVSYNPGTLTVTKAPLIITADNKSKIYGAVNPALTLNYNGFAANEGPANLTTAPIANTAATLTSAAGTSYDINVNGASALNYDIQYVKGQLTIGKATLKVTADNQSKIYGAINPALTFFYNGFVNNETVAALSTKPTATTSATASSNAGDYIIIPAGGVATNYNLVYANGTLTINKAVLIVTADNQTRPYKTPDPAFTASYTGFVNGDTQASLISPALITSSATTNSSVGNYAIVAKDAVATNYTFNYNNGTLSITKGTRSIAFSSPLVKTYGDADFDPGATSTNNDAIVYTSSNAAAATVVQGKIHITGAGSTTLTASLPDDPNYFSTATVSQLLTINKAQQTISFAAIPAQNRGTTYDLSLVRSSSGLPVTFTSSDPKIAAIDDQALKSVSIGRTRITASQVGNSNYFAANNATQEITVQDAAGNEIIVKQAMSPNGDGVNDMLYIEGIREHPNNRVTLLNRNGVKVFEVSGYDNVTKAFDGHSNVTGSMLQAGTYFYLIEYTQDGVGRHKTGYFVLKF